MDLEEYMLIQGIMLDESSLKLTHGHKDEYVVTIATLGGYFDKFSVWASNIDEFVTAFNIYAHQFKVDEEFDKQRKEHPETYDYLGASGFMAHLEDYRDRLVRAGAKMVLATTDDNH